MRLNSRQEYEALLARVEALEAAHRDHQHSYAGPIGLGVRWFRTGPDLRESDDAAHERYMAADRAKRCTCVAPSRHVGCPVHGDEVTA